MNRSRNNAATRAHAAVRCDEANLIVELADGRTPTAPLAWFPRLADASPDARADCELLGDGLGMHWPAIDEDISVPARLAGRRAHNTQRAICSPTRPTLRTRITP